MSIKYRLNKRSFVTKFKKKGLVSTIFKDIEICFVNNCTSGHHII